MVYWYQKQALSDKQLSSIVDYVKKNYPGKTLQDNRCSEKENHYLYISVSFSTTKRNEAKADLYFLTAK